MRHQSGTRKKPVSIVHQRENGALQDLQVLMKTSLFQEKANAKRSMTSYSVYLRKEKDEREKFKMR